MNTQVQLFKALGDETRLRVLLLLLRHTELCVCDLEAALDMPQSTVSRHLAVLRNANLVEGERRGVWMYYRLNRKYGISKAIFKCLKKYCLTLEQASADTHRLNEFLKTKNVETCSKGTGKQEDSQ
ncbi:ArsR/SmtB family transcription factor [Desulfogranum japonicum]|uniref:ArsR/SmtB family transcription factor n=1 Tax=Desulfogranum japonicum TaxID=231447 RepID=UPI0005509858|nr:metalloregulator ArsR/SmtB family transcription factor [Desulfogranum japonicum]